MSSNSSAISLFEPLRSLFIELITRNQHLGEKVNQLEKQHYNNINELKVIIDQANEQMMRFNELQNDNQSFKEQIKQLKQQCQQGNEAHIKELEHTNHRLNNCITQLNDQSKNNNIQIKRSEDEYRELKEQADQFEKQSQTQHENHMKELEDTNAHLKTCIHEHDDRLKQDQVQMKELQSNHQELQKQFCEHITRFNEIENRHSQEQTNQLREQYQQENQTYIRELENTNSRLDALFVLLDDSLQDNETQMKKFVDENQQLKEEVNNLRKQDQIQTKELVDISDRVNIYVNEHNDRLKIDQIQIKELKTENEQFKKQVNELQYNIQSFKEHIKKLEQQCQQENQAHIKELEHTNHRFNDCITQLNDQLKNNNIQIKRSEDEYRELKEQANQLEKQSKVQHENHMKELKDTNAHFNTCIHAHDDRLKQDQVQMKELKIENEQFKKQVNELQNENQFFKEQSKQLKEQCQEKNQTHIKTLNDINGSLNARITQLTDQRDNTEIRIKRVEDENRQLREVCHLEQQLLQQQQIRIKELVDISDDFRTCIKEHDDRLNKDHIRMKELKTENEQFKKQVNEQMMRCDELQNDNQCFKEQLTEQQQSVTTEVKDTNSHLNSCLTQLNNQSEKNEKLEIKSEPFKKHQTFIIKREPDNHSQNKAGVQTNEPIDTNDGIGSCVFRMKSERSQTKQNRIKRLSQIFETKRVEPSQQAQT